MEYVGDIMKKPKHNRRHQKLKAILLDKRWEYLKHLEFNVSSACGIK